MLRKFVLMHFSRTHCTFCTTDFFPTLSKERNLKYMSTRHVCIIIIIIIVIGRLQRSSTVYRAHTHTNFYFVRIFTANLALSPFEFIAAAEAAAFNIIRYIDRIRTRAADEEIAAADV